MKIRKIISAILTMSVMSACIIPIAKADGLYSEKFDMTKVKADKTDGVTKEVLKSFLPSPDAAYGADSRR